MTVAAPTFSQIKAQVAAIRQKFPRARVIGIRAPGRWSGETVRQDGGETYVIRQCDSPLAMRLALREQTDGDATKVLVTSLDENDLSQDILSRLARPRLFPIDSWQIVQSLFQARIVDPRLTRHPWMADVLLELEDYPPARGGFLDAETVWPLLLGRTIGLSPETPDLTAILKWSIDADATAKFRAAGESFREGTIQWLTERAGPAAEAVLRCVERLERPDALALGLAAGVVFDPGINGRLEKPAGRLEERYLGGEAPDPAVLERWSAAATEVVQLQRTDARVKRQQLQRADEILKEVQAESFAWVSDTSLLGFDQRLARFGDRLARLLQQRELSALDELYEARQFVRDHHLAAGGSRRLERIDMALRLVRRLAQSRTEEGKAPRSFAEAADRHLRDGGYVDWARLALRAGDPVRELSEAYARLFDEVTALREQQACEFAGLLRDWTAAGSSGEDVVPVERILEEIVAPLAAEVPVLVIVIDGMSVAVCRELFSDLTRHEWTPLSEPGRSFTRLGIATIPSITEASRTSLLCGRLRMGSSGDERAGFAEHPALLARCRSGYPPVLFHKASLQEAPDAVLAPEIRQEIESPQRRIVGVVINAVDDHLLKGEQIDTHWSPEEIRVLPALLHEARSAGRIVVVVSDHGHVLDCNTQARPNEGGERWRADDGRPEADELRIEGNRVLTEEHRLIAPWSEQVRYGIKKNGYHGGLSPQEMVVPIVVLTAADEFPAGWHETPIETPAWWDEPTGVEPPMEPTKRRIAPVKPPGRLFDPDAEAETVREVEPARPEFAMQEPGDAVAAWIARLLASPVFEDQKRLGGRHVPDDELFARFLAALDRRGGKLTSAALARTLDYSPLRLRGLISVAQRVLNVDGYPVLSRDEASDTIELNRELLLKQFDLQSEL